MNVLIGQYDCFQNITGHFGRVSNYAGSDFYQGDIFYRHSVKSHSGWTSGGGEDFNIIGLDTSRDPTLRTGTETRPTNYTVRIWKRIN